MGKRRSGRQGVFILGENNSIADSSLDADIGYASSPDTVEAWVLDRNQQGIDEITGNIIQTISERTCKPVIVFDLDNAKQYEAMAGKNVNTIASQQEDVEIAFMERKKSRMNLLLWIGIIATIFAITISLVVLKSL